MKRALAVVALILAAAVSPAVIAQTVSGRAFEDRNGDGIWDPGEPLLSGVSVQIFGRRTGGSLVDETGATDLSGAFQFSPGNGCYLLLPVDPPGWRSSTTRSDGFDPSTPGYTLPVGEPRFAKLDQGIANLRAGTLRYAAMGDSIMRNFNVCSFPPAFWYSTQVRSRLACVAPSATITLDQAAVLGEHTDDLLVDDRDNLNNVFRAIENQPRLIAISMIGNDMLDVDPGPSPTPQQVNKAVAEILDARQNLQEALSAMTSQIPSADIVLQTLYDQLAYNCATGNSTTFHRQWLPIVNRILRDLAWGQTRRASTGEVAPEFAMEDLNGACTGFQNKICRDLLGLDKIHPNNDGYTIVREKIWESVGGASLGSGDALGRTSIQEIDHGFLRRVRRLSPTRWEVRNGAAVVAPEAAFSDQDGGAPAQVTVGAGSEEFLLSGFPDWFDEIQIVRATAGVRYRTAGAPLDDFYRIEASVTGQFRPDPGFDYTTTDWNFFTPIVGGGGPNQPAENPDYPTAKILAVPAPASYREVSATLSKNPVVAPGGSEYDWPPLTLEDLAITRLRVVAAPVAGTAGNDAYQIELDHAWLDLYGWEKPRPPEAGNLEVRRLADGTLVISFASIDGAQRYNLYAGRIAAGRAGFYDHGSGAPAGPWCDAPVQDAGSGRLAIHLAPAAQAASSIYFLLTAHVDDVESPAGLRSDGTEIDRSQSICR